jgi:hypothetical protein
MAGGGAGLVEAGGSAVTGGFTTTGGLLGVTGRVTGGVILVLGVVGTLVVGADVVTTGDVD